MLAAKGYSPAGEKPEFQEYLHPNENWAIPLSIYKGGIAITVPYWKDAANAVDAALINAKELADVAQLTLYDPQVGYGDDEESDYPEDEKEM